MAFPFAVPRAGSNEQVVVLEVDGLKVTAFRVDHGPVSPAVGYRFDYKGRSLVISGDTSPAPSVIAASHGVDLLVHEALQPRLVAMMAEALDAKGLKNTAQIMRDIPNYHTTPEQAAEAAREFGAKELVLSHIVPSIPSRFFNPVFLGDARKRYSGPIIVGEDGMFFSLPAGSAVIDEQNLL